MSNDVDTRAEHLEFAKKRALEYVDRGDYDGAMTSFISDLGNHPELAGHPVGELMLMHAVTGNLNERNARQLITGTN